MKHTETFGPASRTKRDAAVTAHRLVSASENKAEDSADIKPPLQTAGGTSDITSLYYKGPHMDSIYVFD